MATWAESLEGSFTWKIEEFSKLSDEVKYSEPFEIGGYKWRLQMYPKGDGQESKGHLSLYLEVADKDDLPKGWTRTASCTLIVHRQSDPEKSVRKVYSKIRLYSKNRLFNKETPSLGRPKFMKLDELNDAQKGFLVDDSITVEVKVKVQPDFRQRFTKNDGAFSPLCLRFDGISTESDTQQETPVPNQKKRVKLDPDANQQSCPSMLFLGDAGFMNYSSLVKGMIEDMNLRAKRSQIVIPIPKGFCPGRCSLEDVQLALCHFYFPREFPLEEYHSSIHKLLQVADYFQIRYLTLDIEGYLLNQIEKKLKTNSMGDVNQIMEWMLWSESFDLKRCWSALKRALIRQKAFLKLILKHENFEKLSLKFQTDFMKSALL